MDLYEHQGKDLFRAQGIATPRGIVATTGEQAAEATRELGGRASSRCRCRSVAAARAAASCWSTRPSVPPRKPPACSAPTSRAIEVTQVLVEELLPIAQEFYTSILLDRSTGDYLAMMTAEGGMDIEELARTRPEALRRVHVDPMLGLRAFHVRELTGTLPLEAREGAADVLRRLYALLREPTPPWSRSTRSCCSRTGAWSRSTRRSPSTTTRCSATRTSRR